MSFLTFLVLFFCRLTSKDQDSKKKKKELWITTTPTASITPKSTILAKNPTQIPTVVKNPAQIPTVVAATTAPPIVFAKKSRPPLRISPPPPVEEANLPSTGKINF